MTPILKIVFFKLSLHLTRSWNSILRQRVARATENVAPILDEGWPNKGDPNVCCDRCFGRPSLFGFHIHPPWTEICQTASLQPGFDCKVMGHLPQLGEQVAPHSWGGMSAIRYAGAGGGLTMASPGGLSIITQVLE